MNEQLIKFIELCLADGVISDKEREVIFRKAKALGVDEDECEIILEGKIYEKKNLSQSEVKKNKAVLTKERKEKKSYDFKENSFFKLRGTELLSEIKNLNNEIISESTRLHLISEKIEHIQEQYNQSYDKYNELFFDILKHSRINDEFMILYNKIKIKDIVENKNKLNKMIKDECEITFAEPICKKDHYGYWRNYCNSFKSKDILKKIKRPNLLHAIYGMKLKGCIEEIKTDRGIVKTRAYIYNRNSLFSRPTYEFKFHEKTEPSKVEKWVNRLGKPLKHFLIDYDTKKKKYDLAVLMWEKEFLIIDVCFDVSIKGYNWASTTDGRFAFYSGYGVGEFTYTEAKLTIYQNILNLK